MEIQELISSIKNANKITVFGWPATGKTTFSSVLSTLLNLPLYSLDNIRWKNLKDNKKNDEEFLKEYNKIIKQDKWLIEGNALDWIDSRLKLSNIIFYFDSTPEQSIRLYQKRAQFIEQQKQGQKDFDENLHTMSGFEEWVKTRYAKKIENLKPILKNFNYKLIVVKNFEEINLILNELSKIKF